MRSSASGGLVCREVTYDVDGEIGLEGGATSIWADGQGLARGTAGTLCGTIAVDVAKIIGQKLMAFLRP